MLHTLFLKARHGWHVDTGFSSREDPLLSVKPNISSLSDALDKEPLAFTPTVTPHSLPFTQACHTAQPGVH